MGPGSRCLSSPTNTEDSSLTLPRQRLLFGARLATNGVRVVECLRFPSFSFLSKLLARYSRGKHYDSEPELKAITEQVENSQIKQ
ncbi:hypothetical protein Hamer_G028368 [Homarus americanus]|uniref:Uncharacterized protein n=1 Tax=Homarus americanus TaxID=6706 RepID=A0A8J5JHM9_HOMAM|nr:hypothetical protein Hamer_G028368 [Homarus americanus]